MHDAELLIVAAPVTSDLPTLLRDNPNL